MSTRRTLNQKEGITNPAKKFIEWKSGEKCFGYYDKEKKEDVLIPLPLKIQFLEEFHTIKGFDEQSDSSIYSNEIKTMKEPLKVKAFKRKEPIAEGLYNEIKHEVKAAGGKYGKSVYALLDGEIVNLQLYGASISPFILYTSGDKKTNTKGHSQVLETNFIEVNSYTDKKKGANKYTEPVFTLGDRFTEKENELANEKYKDVVIYFNEYSKKDTNNITVVDVEEVSPEVEF
tara:strand:- start:243 stop:935 length:693 start_codon:yes stop_codon:yes gene_type:complete